MTSGPPAASTSAATPVPASQAGDGAPAPPSGALTGDPITLDTAADYRILGAEQENADRARGRVSATMAEDLGPDATAVAAAMDQQESDGLWALVDGATTASLSPARAMTLASVRLPRPGPRAVSIPPPGMSFLGPWITSLMLVESSLEKGTAYNKSTHDEEPVESGANKGTITTDSTVSVTPSGSQLTVDVVTKTKGELSDESGRLIFRIDGNGHAHIEVQACPDASGVATVRVEFSASELYFISGGGDRAGNSWQDDDKGDGQIFSNDEAALDHTVLGMATDHANKGGSKAAGAGQSTLSDETISTTTTGVTLDAAGHGSGGESSYTGHGTTMDAVKGSLHDAGTFVGGAMLVTAKAAEKFWRSGKCIDVAVDPKGGDVGANSATTVTAKVRQHFENVELDKPVAATMSGIKSIEPSGKKVPSPATFTYTAGAKPKDAGIVTFKSVSNRGIGETTVTFTVGGAWKVEGHDHAGTTIDGQKCGGLGGQWTLKGHIKGQGIETTSTYVATIDETTLAGTYTYKSVGTVDTGFGVIKTTLTGKGKASLVAQADGSYLMTLAGTTIKSTATGAGTTQTTSAAIPDLPFTWTPGGTCPS